MIACLIELFTISWHLTIVVICGGALIGIFYMFTEYFYLKMQKKSDTIKEILSDLLKKSFATYPSEFSKITNKYDLENEELFTQNKKETCCLTFNKMLNLLVVYIYQIMIVYYCTVLYDRSIIDD